MVAINQPGTISLDRIRPAVTVEDVDVTLPQFSHAPREIRVVVKGRQVIGSIEATEMLIPYGTLDEMYWKLLDDDERALVVIELTEQMQHHVDCWAEYLLKMKLPSSWRGRLEIVHYELVVCGFKKVVKPDPSKARGVRVRRRQWLRRARRADQHEATRWFRALPAGVRAELAASYRFEDTAQQAESRYVARANRDHRAELDLLSRRH